jgi:hypothetical protein
VINLAVQQQIVIWEARLCGILENISENEKTVKVQIARGGKKGEDDEACWQIECRIIQLVGQLLIEMGQMGRVNGGGLIRTGRLTRSDPYSHFRMGK